MAMTLLPLKLATRVIEAQGGIVYFPPPIEEPVEIDLTPGQWEVFDLLGRVPRLPRDIATDTHYALNTVRHFLTVLRHKGYVDRVGPHNTGGWIRLREPFSNQLQAAA